MDHGVVPGRIFLERFQCSLRGAALTWFKAQPAATRDNWAELQTSFKANFRDEAFVRELKASVYQWRQGAGEDLADYIARCQKTWEKVNVSAAADQEDALHFFVQGLRDSQW